jgi:hypothetical protein
MADRDASPRRDGSGADRISVTLFSVAGFLAVLALLGSQLGQTAAHSAHRPVVVRRIYATTVDERVIGPRDGTASSSSTESSSSSAAAPLPPLASRTS